MVACSVFQSQPSSSSIWSLIKLWLNDDGYCVIEIVGGCLLWPYITDTLLEAAKLKFGGELFIVQVPDIVWMLSMLIDGRWIIFSLVFCMGGLRALKNRFFFLKPPEGSNRLGGSLNCGSVWTIDLLRDLNLDLFFNSDGLMIPYCPYLNTFISSLVYIATKLCLFSFPSIIWLKHTFACSQMILKSCEFSKSYF